MAEKQIKISSVCRQSLTIIVESINLAIRQWNTSDTVAPTIITVRIFVDVVAQVDHVVDGIFACSVSVGIKEAKGVITA